MAGFITQPLEAAIAQAQGIEYLASSSTTGSSTITATLRLNYDSNRALTEISAKVNSVRNQLPPQAQQPVVNIDVGDTTAAMYVGFFTDTLPPNGVTDYLIRVVQPKLDAIPGVQSADVQGARVYALRAWLDPERMAARNVAASDVYNALAANNYLTAVGSTKGQMVSVDLTAGHRSAHPRRVPSAHRAPAEQHGRPPRGCRDRGTGPRRITTPGVSWNGSHSVFLAIQNAPKANVLQVAQAVRDALPAIQQQLPSGMRAEVVYDTTQFVRSSIREVIKTLVEALLIVTVVIFLFLGSVRATAVPMVAMPLSLVGTFFVMLVLGYSINLLTLLALVLAIGLVVDDAIIVVENSTGI